MAALLRKNNQLRNLLFAVRQVSFNSGSIRNLELAISKRPTQRAFFLNVPRCFATAAHQYEAQSAQSKVLNSVGDDAYIDQLLLKIDSDAKSFGQVRWLDLNDVLERIKKTGCATSIQGLYLIRCCGSLLCYDTPDRRTDLAHKIWNMLQELGVPLDASHYNAMLKVYLENEHPFTPSEFLSSMENNGVTANRVTYQRIIEKYCCDGDLTAASAILEHMKEKNMAINETIFNCLILGHARAKDMDGAKNMLEVMRKSKISPSSETYTTLACGYAENGDIEEFKNVLKLAEENQHYISAQNYLQIIQSLATTGNHECIDEVMEKIDVYKCKSDFMNAGLIMAYKGFEDTAYKLLMNIEPSNFTRPVTNFIRILIEQDKPIETILKYCKSVLNRGFHDYIFEESARNAMLCKKRDIAIELFKEMKNLGKPVRIHYFWPIIAQCRQEGNEQEIWSVLNIMTEMGIVIDMETYIDFIFPGLSKADMNEVICKIKEIGQPEAAAVDSAFLHCLQENRNLALDLLSKYDVQASVYPTINIIVDHCKDDVNFAMQVFQHFYKREIDPEFNPYGIFLQKLINRFPEDMNLCERYLQEYQLKEVVLPEMFARSIADKLKYLAPDLLKFLEPPEPFSKPSDQYIHPMKLDLPELEQRLADAEKTGENIRPLLRHLLTLYCRNKNIDRVLQIKAELDKLDFSYSPAAYAMLLNHFVLCKNFEEAYKCKKDLCEQYPHFQIDVARGVDYVNLMFKNQKIDEALNVLQTEASSWAPPHDPLALDSGIMKLLNTVSETGDVELTKKVLGILVHEQKFVNPKAAFLQYVINAYLKRNDYDAAIEEYNNYVERYRCFPNRNALFRTFILLKDPERLQKVVDISTLHGGKSWSLHELACAFVETGCIQEARRVMQTLGVNANASTLNSICERFVRDKKATELLQFISITKDLNHIDKDNLYSLLLSLYDGNNDYQAALEMWNTMQEENVRISSDTLGRLAALLERNNQPIPFVSPSYSAQTISAELLHLIEDKNEIAVIQTLQRMRKGDIHSLTPRNFTNIVDLLVEKNCLKEISSIVQAMSFILSKPAEILKPVFQKYADLGDVKSVKELYNFLPEFVHKYVNPNAYFFDAFLISGQAEELLAFLEENANSARKLFSTKKFLRLLKEHPELESRAAKLVDLYEQGDFEVPKITLWLHYFLGENNEKADEIYKTKFNLILMADFIFVNIMTEVRLQNNETLGRKLIDLANKSMKQNIRSRAYSCLLDVLVNHSKLEEALALIEEAKQSGISETQLLSPSLMNLKNSLLAKNMAVPFEIPFEDRFASSSNNSSSEESD